MRHKNQNQKIKLLLYFLQIDKEKDKTVEKEEIWHRLKVTESSVVKSFNEHDQNIF